jgi:hypothetical protein
MSGSSSSSQPFFDYILPYGGGILLLGAFLFALYYFLKKRRLGTMAQTAADLVILKIMVPKETEPEEETERRKDFKEVMAVAEQFFSSLAAITQHDGHGFFRTAPTISLEIIAREAIRFFIGVPREYQELLEKQVLAYYPNAAIEETKEFRLFEDPPEKGLIGAGVELRMMRSFVLPIKTYKELESDPFNAISGAFSKIGEQSRGALQILIRPTNGYWQHQVAEAAHQIQAGHPSTMLADSLWLRALMWLGYSFGDIFDRRKPGEMKEPVKLTPMQDELLKDLNEKSTKIGYETQIRALVLAPTLPEAQVQLGTITSTFAQFHHPRVNGFRVIRHKNFAQFATHFVMRAFTGGRKQILNTEELASLYHLPTRFTQTPNIEWLLARTLAPPVNLPTEGLQLGESIFRGERQPVRMLLNDRRRHLYAIGKTGVGKTTLFTYMLEQDIREGRGCAYFDPNGDAIESILTLIPPERADDVILFDPSDTAWPMGLNMLEWHKNEDRDFLVAEWIEIFYKLFDPNRTGMVGPQFEHWGRNASLTVMNMPGGGTLLDIPRLFVDDKFREYAVGHVTDPMVRTFWEQQLAKTSDFHKSEMYNYFISKFGRFMTNDIVRNIIGQTKSAFNFREIMDSGKILLVNLSKGKIGETNSNLLGMILVAKLQVAAFQRADIEEEKRQDFFLYVDEFQNFTTGTFKTILSEARKYRLNLNITNQYIAQLPEDIRDAVIGNAGTLISYRIGAADAEFLEKEFAGVTKEDMTNLTFANMYVKLLIEGTPSKPFSMRSIKSPSPPNHELAEAIRQLTRLKYGIPSARVEAVMTERMRMGKDAAEPPTPPGGLRLA